MFIEHVFKYIANSLNQLRLRLLDEHLQTLLPVGIDLFDKADFCGVLGQFKLLFVFTGLDCATGSRSI